MSSLKPTFATISTDEDLSSWMTKSKDMLLVLDLHLSWTGPCESLKAIFEGIGKQYSIEACCDRLAILTVECPKFSPALSKVLGGDKENNGGFEKVGCQPLFALVRGGKLRKLVEGADVPELEKLILKHIPAHKDENDEGDTEG